MFDPDVQHTKMTLVGLNGYKKALILTLFPLTAGVFFVFISSLDTSFLTC